MSYRYAPTPVGFVTSVLQSLRAGLSAATLFSLQSLAPSRFAIGVLEDQIESMDYDIEHAAMRVSCSA